MYFQRNAGRLSIVYRFSKQPFLKINLIYKMCNIAKSFTIPADVAQLLENFYYAHPTLLTMP